MRVAVLGGRLGEGAAGGDRDNARRALASLLDRGQRLLSISGVGHREDQGVAADPLRQGAVALYRSERNSQARFNHGLHNIARHARSAHSEHDYRVDTTGVGQALSSQADLPALTALIGKTLDRAQHVLAVDSGDRVEVVEVGHGFMASSMSMIGMSSRTG